MEGKEDSHAGGQRGQCRIPTARGEPHGRRRTYRVQNFAARHIFLSGVLQAPAERYPRSSALTVRSTWCLTKAKTANGMAIGASNAHNRGPPFWHSYLSLRRSSPRPIALVTDWTKTGPRLYRRTLTQKDDRKHVGRHCV